MNVEVLLFSGWASINSLTVLFSDFENRISKLLQRTILPYSVRLRLVFVNRTVIMYSE